MLFSSNIVPQHWKVPLFVNEPCWLCSHQIYYWKLSYSSLKPRHGWCLLSSTPLTSLSECTHCKHFVFITPLSGVMIWHEAFTQRDDSLWGRWWLATIGSFPSLHMPSVLVAGLHLLLLFLDFFLQFLFLCSAIIINRDHLSFNP